MHAVRWDDFSFTYARSQQEALAGVTLTLDEGELLGVTGPSGAGKSTLCMTMNGLVPLFTKGKADGAVHVGGVDTSKSRVPELAKRVALVFQDFEAQLFSSSVAHDVAFALENQGVPRAEMVRRVQAALATVGLAELAAREPARLSGGQKQRVALAAALAMQSEVLGLDESTTDLDPVGKREVYRIVDALRKDTSRAILMVDHDIDRLVDTDRIAVMSTGKVTLAGTPREVLSSPHVNLVSVGGTAADVSKLLDLPGFPITVEETQAAVASSGLVVPADAAKILRDEDLERRSRYGNVLIEVDDVTYTYPGSTSPALSNVGITIQEREFVAIVGQNGSGKSTLSKHFNGLIQSQSGRVRIAGVDVTTLPLTEVARHVGYVFQNPDYQIFASTIGEEVAFGPQNLKLDNIDGLVAEALEAVGLAGMEDEDPFLLTKGDRQRVAVASALATRPAALVLDEPTTGLNTTEQWGMMELLRRLNEAGHTIVIITHSMGVVAQYATRTVAMRRGQVEFDGGTRELLTGHDDLEGLWLEAPQLCRLGRALGAPLLHLDDYRRFLLPGGKESANLAKFPARRI